MNRVLSVTVMSLKHLYITLVTLYYVVSCICTHIRTRVPCEYCRAAERSHLHGWMHLGVASARAHTCRILDSRYLFQLQYSKFLFVHNGARCSRTEIWSTVVGAGMTTGCIYPVFHFVYCCVLLCRFYFSALTTPSPGPWFMAAACCCTWAERSSSGSLGWWTHLSCTCPACQLLWTSPFLTSLRACRTTVSRCTPISSATRHCHFWAWKHKGRLAATSKICRASQLQWGVKCLRVASNCKNRNTRKTY